MGLVWNHNNLRQTKETLFLPSIRTVYHGNEIFSHLGLNFGKAYLQNRNKNLLQQLLKNLSNNINLYTRCRLCNASINGAGFLQVSNECSKMCLSSCVFFFIRQNIRCLVLQFLILFWICAFCWHRLAHWLYFYHFIARLLGSNPS